jgi:hypothetical protein
MKRKGLGIGLGKGYKNIIPNYDSNIHSLSAKGVKQHTFINPIPKKQVDKFIKKIPIGDKIDYLKNIGLFREEYLKEITEKELDELVKSALEVKGVVDSDGDKMPDQMDCKPFNPKKQHKKITNKIILRFPSDSQIAYLKRQEDGRFTINSGLKGDSGYDTWYSTEASNEKQAKEYFEYFKEQWGKLLDEKIDPMEFDDKLTDKDIYRLDESEMEEYY